MTGNIGSNTPPPLPPDQLPTDTKFSTSSLSEGAQEIAKDIGELDDVHATGLSLIMGSISKSDKAALIAEAQTLMSDPTLPAGDQQKLSEWISALQGSQISTVVGNSGDPPPPPIGKVAHKSNPYMEPGIMALLYPLLGEVQKAMNDIVLQSSKLSQNMIKLTLSMAKDAFDFSIAAGKLRADMLRQDAVAMFTQAATQLMQAGASLIAMGVSNVSEAKAQKAADEKFMTENNINPPDPVANRQGLDDFLKKPENEMQATNYNKERLNIQTNAQQKQQLVNSLIQQFGGSISNITQGVVDLNKAGMTEQEAILSATAQMLDKLGSIVQQTMNKADESSKSAVQFLEQIANLVQQYSSTVTRAFYNNA